MKIKVSAIQMSMSWDIEKNISKAISYVRDAAAKGANINLEPNIEDLNIGQNQENYIEKYLSELSDIKDTTSSRDVQIMSMLE